MGRLQQGLKVFICPKCRKTYFGQDPLPDCPACGFDYQVREGFRWDVLVYLLSILGLFSFLLVSSLYRIQDSGTRRSEVPRADRDEAEKLPGIERSPTFRSPYQDINR